MDIEPRSRRSCYQKASWGGCSPLCSATFFVALQRADRDTYLGQGSQISSMADLYFHSHSHSTLLRAALNKHATCANCYMLTLQHSDLLPLPHFYYLCSGSHGLFPAAMTAAPCWAPLRLPSPCRVPSRLSCTGCRTIYPHQFSPCHPFLKASGSAPLLLTPKQGSSFFHNPAQDCSLALSRTAPSQGPRAGAWTLAPHCTAWRPWQIT